MSGIFVRPAQADDLQEIGIVQLRTWQAGNSPGVPRDALEGISAADISAGWELALRAPPSPRHRVLVAVDAGPVVGLAAVGPAADPDLEPGTEGDLVALFVDPGARGRGHGSRLLTAAIDHLRGDGFVMAVAWVLSDDTEARAFLAGAGWAPDGAWRDLEVPGGGTVRQVRLSTALTDRP